MIINKIYQGDSLNVLKTLPDKYVNCCVTSPPYYGLRDYGDSEQIGLEETPEQYVEKLVEVFREVYRILRNDGTLWLNLGDSYWGGGWRNATLSEHSGDIQKGHTGTHCGKSMPNLKGRVGEYKPKDLIGIPWMVAFSLRKDGWYLRQDIIWSKPNPMPESVKDRCTKAHEYIFLFSKSQRYYYDYGAIEEKATGYDGRKDTLMKGSTKYKHSTHTMAKRGHERWKFKNLQEDGQQPNTFHEKRASGEKDEIYAIRNKRSVWEINTKPEPEAHFAVFPQKLIDPCIKAGCPEGGIVLDPFIGSGTTAIVARKQNKNYIGIELNSDYIKIAERRIYKELGMFK